MQKRNGVKKKEVKKSTALFDVLIDIKCNKKGTLLDDENNDNYKEFDKFNAMRFLSMNQKICPLINTVNHLQEYFDKKEFYKLLLELIPKIDNEFNRFIKADIETVENEEFVSKYFECSLKQAREYINVMGIDWTNQIKNSFGGKL